MSRAPSPVLDDIDATLREAFALLTRGAADRRSPCHTPVLATIGLDGRPRARIVVLRGFSPDSLEARVHTDARSDKIAEIERDPRVALGFYDPLAGMQIRLEGLARLHRGDSLAKAAWNNSQAMSRRCYAVEPGPGTRLRAAGDFVLPADDEAAGAGEANFTALVVGVERLEWLHLAASGHRRALFTFAPRTEATWLAP